MHLKKSWGLIIVILKVVKKFSTSHAVYWESSTYFLLTSWSAGIIAASDSSSSSCFNTDGAFTVTLLSLTVAPRFLPAVNKEIFSSNCNYWLPALRKFPMTSNLFYFSTFTRQKGNNWTNKAGSVDVYWVVISFTQTLSEKSCYSCKLEFICQLQQPSADKLPKRATRKPSSGTSGFIVLTKKRRVCLMNNISKFSHCNQNCSHSCFCLFYLASQLQCKKAYHQS